MSKNNYIEVEITGAKYPNISTASYNDKKVQFKGGIIGQKVALKTLRQKKDSIKAKLQEVLESSYLETIEGCPQTGVCGGCTYQKLTYEDELNYKRNLINDLFSNLQDQTIPHINASPEIYAYRNKMEYTFGDEFKDGPITLGLHRKNRFYEIVNTIGCNIINSDFEMIRQFTMQFFYNHGFKSYHKIKNEGALKFFIIRYSFATKEIMINLVTKEDKTISEELLAEFVEEAQKLKLEGEIVSAFHTISNSTADAVVPEQIRHIYGQDHITEKINGLQFNISPFSFFQPNPMGAQKLYNKALEFAGDIEDKLVYDLYCGTGTISQIFAKKARKVIGVELIEEAVEKAKENAALNNIQNCEFIANDVLLEIENLTQTPDILVLDPPREGIHPKAIGKILDLETRTVVYISCNPKTMARDLEEFIDRGYKIVQIEVFDQFPRTAHVETVVLIQRETM